MWGFSLQSYHNASAQLNEQAQRQLVTYWRVRITKTLDVLENEVRRMLRVESTLERFAHELVQRLQPQVAALETLPPALAEQLALPRAPFEWVAQGVGAARTRELKARYRQLAKELHPDFYGTETHKPSMREVNAAYAQDDLAALVRLEAQTLAPDATQPASAFEDYMRQVDQATTTYRQAYTQLLHAPLYGLYARATSAQEDGWDFVDALSRRIRRALDNCAASAA